MRVLMQCVSIVWQLNNSDRQFNFLIRLCHVKKLNYHWSGFKSRDPHRPIREELYYQPGDLCSEYFMSYN